MLAPIWAVLRGQLARTPVLAFQLGVLGAVLLEQWQGEAFAHLLEFRRIPRFFGIVDIFEPFSGLDFSGILAPFFPSPNNISASPLQDSGQAIGELATTFVKAFFYQGPRDPGFFDVIGRVLIYDVVVFVVPVLLLAFLLRPLVAAVLTRFPKWSLIILHLV
ncbi:MAG: hypothetical protein IH587_03005, partial [Anaerolineae bacterium]|nr:hypothetical protein [Anaerolineae bacterium]